MKRLYVHVGVRALAAGLPDYTLVDDGVAAILGHKRMHWRSCPQHGCDNVSWYVGGHFKDCYGRYIYLHRFVAGTPVGDRSVVHHKNEKTFDNQFHNLIITGGNKEHSVLHPRSRRKREDIRDST